MLEDLPQWRRSEDKYAGVFDDYTVTGARFQNAVSFEVGWHITVCKIERDLIHDYWVNGKGNFHSANMHDIYGIEVHESPLTEQIDDAEREAVLNAIAEWTPPTNSAQ